MVCLLEAKSIGNGKMRPKDLGDKHSKQRVQHDSRGTSSARAPVKELEGKHHQKPVAKRIGKGNQKVHNTETETRIVPSRGTSAPDGSVLCEVRAQWPRLHASHGSFCATNCEGATHFATTTKSTDDNGNYDYNCNDDYNHDYDQGDDHNGLREQHAQRDQQVRVLFDVTPLAVRRAESCGQLYCVGHDHRSNNQSPTNDDDNNETTNTNIDSMSMSPLPLVRDSAGDFTMTIAPPTGQAIPVCKNRYAGMPLVRSKTTTDENRGFCLCTALGMSPTTSTTTTTRTTSTTTTTDATAVIISTTTAVNNPTPSPPLLSTQPSAQQRRSASSTVTEAAASDIAGGIVPPRRAKPSGGSVPDAT